MAKIFKAQFQTLDVCVQVSFVNSICTIKGGTHVNYITDQITKSALHVMLQPAVLMH